MFFPAFEAYFVIYVIILVFLLIYAGILKPSLSFLVGAIIFITSGILTPREVLREFSNESIASIVLLILITAGLKNNFNIELIFNKLFKNAKNYRSFLLHMMSRVALLSSIINNTPVVAMMTPYVLSWSQKNKVHPSKLLIPLSYAAILGGMITIIGTSTTLVLNGFLVDFQLPQLKINYFLFTGLMVTGGGIFFIYLFGHKLLPSNKDILEVFNKNKRRYIIEMTLSPQSKLIGRSVNKGGLRNLENGYLVEIIRNKSILSPVEPTEIIEKDDILIFAGDTSAITKLVKSGMGLMLPPEVLKNNKGKAEVDVIEAVVSNHSSLVKKTVKKSDFRNRYDAAIVGIHRNGEKISGQIGNIKLKASDLLLLYAGNNFENRVDFFRDLFIISKLRERVKPDKRKVVGLILSAVTAVVLLISGFFSLFISILLIFSIFALFKMITVQDVKREIDLDMVVLLSLSLVIGQAIIKTDTGELMASWILTILAPYGKIAILCGLLVLTSLLTSFITNIGAISIVFPLAYTISNQLNMDGSPFYLAIAYAASAAFLTPIGYQTNLIVYGPGGYHFKDFFKAGLPVTIIYLLITFFCIVLLFRDSLL